VGNGKLRKEGKRRRSNEGVPEPVGVGQIGVPLLKAYRLMAIPPSFHVYSFLHHSFSPSFIERCSFPVEEAPQFDR